MNRPPRIGADVALSDLPGWNSVEGLEAVGRSFRFETFSAAFEWMTRVARAAEAMDHHPEWRNVYNRVDVILTTHDADGVTELDVRLAKIMDSAFADLTR